jgi:hypothetical protein
MRFAHAILTPFVPEILELTATDLGGSIPSEICLMKVSGQVKYVTVNCQEVRCDCCDNCGPPSG